ncbi:Ras protein [Rhizoctonia solani]|uniref:Ras protein n=1 Tax=Rhizoctonia solani TaxID=456999 RepID=A0A8H7IJ80_9AGAM|nr:Ras protein [Rhizoctonia solani]
MGHRWAGEFSGLSSAFFRGADAALFMFDATRPDSVSDLRRWWNEFAAKRPVLEGSEAEFCAVFVGNKVDLLADQERRVNGPSDTEDRAHDWTEPNGGHPPIADKLVNQFLQDLIPTKFDLITTPASSRRRTIDVDKLSQGISLPPPEDDTSGPTRTPGKPYLEPTDAEHEPESPPRSSSRSRSIGIPSRQWHSNYKPNNLSHPSNFLVSDHQPHQPQSKHITRNSQLRHGGSSLLSMETARSHFSSSSTPIQPPPSRSVSHSSSIVSVVTIKPAQRPGSPPGEGILESPQLPEAGNNLLEIGPKLFWSSARTGEGVASVFEYVAHRVIQRWEWEESQLGFEEGIEDDGGPTAQRLRDDWGKGKRSWRAACC